MRFANNKKIVELTDDSRKVKKGSLFVAVKGFTVDGSSFIPEAIAKGAVAIVSEAKPKKEWLSKVEYMQVADSRLALAELAAEWYGNPSKKLVVIGVTGSDGKTTTSHMIYEVLHAAGKKVGLVSTIAARIGDKSIDTGFHVTNPEPLLLQRLLSKMVGAGLKYVVLETTSHGIDQKRVAAINFDIAVLTNISHEHLDYHKTFENYRDTKLKLFIDAKTSILNKDDKSYSYFHKHIHNKKIAYSLVSDADVTPEHLKLNKLMGMSLESVGNYNIQNALAAATVGKYAGISWRVIREALGKMRPPKGRLERVSNNKGIEIIVDFAHTPNALEQVLLLTKKTSKGKVIAVFGCASERDDKKRPMMGRISTDIADISVFTAEDPRREDINKILSEMEAGVTNEKAKYHKIPERGEAISFAINKLAQKGDTVVICGKAHEKSMAYNGVEYAWSDFKAVELALKGKVFKIKRK